MEKINIPKENSLDSLEGVDVDKSPETNEYPQIKELINNYKGISKLDSFPLHSRFGETSLSKLGHPDLGKRWAKAYLKAMIDEAATTGVSHVLNNAFYMLQAEDMEDDELTRKLGEMLGRLYESSGRFASAYTYYRKSYPDKYATKLQSVQLSPMKDGHDNWETRLPADYDDSKQSFPDFHKLPSPKEREVFQAQLYDEFVKSVPEIMKIDAKEEFKLLIHEVGKIVERYKNDM